MPHCEAPVVDGRCPFDRDALPEPGPTPATHFALLTAPDAATALLLPFAEHPWHSRVVAALREDAALSTTDDGAEFVLVALPERLRPSVRDAIAELLDLRAHDRRAHCGLSCAHADEYSAVLTCVFKHLSVNVSLCESTTELDDVAALCQLCRAGEFLQCFPITDVACEWLGSWLEHVTKTERHPEFIRLALQCLCDADMARPARAVAEKLDLSSFVFARSPELDPTFLSTMLSAEFSFGYLGCIATAIPTAILDYIPPCALPHRVVETQLPCWPNVQSDPFYCVEVFHGVRDCSDTVKYILYVGSASRPENCEHGTLHFNTWDLLQPFLPFKADGIVLPPGIPNYAPVFSSALFSSATSITFPSDYRDEHWGSFTGDQCKGVKQLDLSRTQITAIPADFFSSSNLTHAFLPPTLKTLRARAFCLCAKLREVTGLHCGVTIEPTAFACSPALPVSTFTDLPAAPSVAALQPERQNTPDAATKAVRSARKKRPRNH